MQAPPFNLTRLRLFRDHGQVPKLPVFVTNSPMLAQNMLGVGALAIHAKPSDSDLDWSAIAGCDVILDVPDTDTWTPLMQAIRTTNPRSLRVFAQGRLSALWSGHA